MLDVFVAYSSSNRQKVNKLVVLLERQGWEVWWDQKIPPGVIWTDFIEAKIKIAKCVIVVWTKSSIKSDVVKEEARIAKELQKIIPVKFDNIAIPLGFGNLQTIDLKYWGGNSDNTRFLSFLEAISLFIGKPIEDKIITRKRKAKKKAPQKVQRRPNPAFMTPMQPSPALAAIVGNKPLPRTEIVKKIWDYIKANNLQSRDNKRVIIVDDKLSNIIPRKKSVNLFELTKYISKNIR